MKLGVSFLLNAVLGYLITLFLPWWSVVLISVGLGYMMQLKALPSFAAGFAGMSALWGTYAGILDAQNGAILSNQVADLFSLPVSSYLIVIVTTIGGFLGGLGAVVGSFGRELVEGMSKR